MIKDLGIADLLRQIKEELKDNKPVQAYLKTEELERYLAMMTKDGMIIQHWEIKKK